jgi:hypothetical protein
MSSSTNADYEKCTDTAMNGNLKYAHEQGCLYAARVGDLECLTYAHEQGCPWNENTCSFAADNGHLVCLKYAHEQGCPWDEKTCLYAEERGHLECLHYAWKNGCEWNAFGKERRTLIRRMVREISLPKLRLRCKILLLVRWWQFKLLAMSVNVVPDSDGRAPLAIRLEFENDMIALEDYISNK